MQQDRLESYLRGKMGDLRIDRMIRAFPGFSRETWLVWFAGGESVVVRAEPPALVRVLPLPECPPCPETDPTKQHRISTRVPSKRRF